MSEPSSTFQGPASRVSVEELLEQLQITQTELEKVRVRPHTHTRTHNTYTTLKLIRISTFVMCLLRNEHLEKLRIKYRCLLKLIMWMSFKVVNFIRLFYCDIHNTRTLTDSNIFLF